MDAISIREKTVEAVDVQPAGPEKATARKEVERMKTARFRRYGGPEVMEIVTVEKPLPADDEILVKILRTTVTATESTFRKGQPYFARLFTGLRKPRITTLGEELAGVVEAVGSNVKSFAVGDEVFGTAGPEFGANAEYICLPEDGVLVKKPANLSFDEAAGSIDGGLTALPFLRDTGEIRNGQKVLIYGASGSVGSAAVQLARYFGAEVTAVCSGANAELVKSAGAAHTIDYTKKDFTETGERYDIIFDTVGKTSFSRCKGSLKENGIYLQAGITLEILPRVLWTALFGKKKARIAATGLRPPAERKKDLLFLKELLETGKMKPVIDKSYPLDRIVEAHRYVDTGRKKGNVVINVERARDD